MKKTATVKQCLLAAALVGSAAAANAGGIGFRFGDDIFGLSIAGDLNSQTSAQVDWLHHDDDADLLTAGLFANGSRGSVQGRMGAKIVGITADDPDFDGGALALGGDISLPLNDVLRLRGGLYLAPDVTSFNDVKEYQEWNAGVEISVFQNSALQVGYSYIELEAEGGGELEFEDGVFIRMQLRL